MKRSRYTLTLLFIVFALIAAACNSNTTETTQTTTTLETSSTTTLPEDGTTTTSTVTATSIATGDHDAVLGLEEISCEYLELPELVEGDTRDVTCGTLTVPEIRGPGADSATISINYIQYHQRNTQNPPIIYLDGGPGGATLESMDYYEELFAPYMEQYDMIFFDQRGIGYSNPELDCPAAIDTIMEGLQTAGNSEEDDIAYVETMLECNDDAVEYGVTLSAYNTYESAADATELMEALGYEQWNLLGISYGTFLGQAILQVYPDKINAAVLDSVVPLEADMEVEFYENTEIVFDKFFNMCQQDATCNDAYPELETDFYQLVIDMDAEPKQVDAGIFGEDGVQLIEVDGSIVIAGLFVGLYDAQVAAILPLFIDDAANGTGIYEIEDLGLSALASLAITFASDTNSAFLMGDAVDCHDEIPFTDFVAAQKAQEDAGRIGETFGGDMQLTQEYCAALKTGAADAMMNQPIMSNVPLLTLGGGLDPITPPRYAQQVAQNGGGTFIEYPTLGHGASTEPCPAENVLSFLANPTTPIDTSCIAEMPAIDFVVD